MTVASTTRKQNFAGGQETLTFSFRALVNYPSYINVIATNNSSGTITTLVYGVDYSVSLNSDGIGGIVTVSPTYSTAYTYTVYRSTSDIQASDYDDYNQFPADTVEGDFDRRTLISQEKSDDVSRAAKVPVSSSISDVVLPTPVDGMVLAWSGTNGTVVNVSVATLGAIVVDADGTLAANSDARVATQKAVKTYVNNYTGGTSGVRSVFYNSTVTSGSMVITYSTVAFPYVKTVVVVNSNGTQVIPDSIVFAASSCTITMSSYLPIAGTWGTIVIG